MSHQMGARLMASFRHTTWSTNWMRHTMAVQNPYNEPPTFQAVKNQFQRLRTECWNLEVPSSCHVRGRAVRMNPMKEKTMRKYCSMCQGIMMFYLCEEDGQCPWCLYVQ